MKLVSGMMADLERGILIWHKLSFDSQDLDEHPVHGLYSNGRSVADQCERTIVVVEAGFDEIRPIDSSLLLFRKNTHSFFLRSVDGIAEVGIHSLRVILWSHGVTGVWCDESQMYQEGVRPCLDLPRDDLIIGQGRIWFEVISTHCSIRNMGREQFQKDLSRIFLRSDCKIKCNIACDEPGINQDDVSPL
jgi:hypothetical protein